MSIAEIIALHEDAQPNYVLPSGSILTYQMVSWIQCKSEQGCTPACMPCHFYEMWNRELAQEDFRDVLMGLVHATDHLPQGGIMIVRSEGFWLPAGIYYEVLRLAGTGRFLEVETIKHIILDRFEVTLDDEDLHWIFSVYQERSLTAHNSGTRSLGPGERPKHSGRHIDDLPVVPVTAREGGHRTSFATPPPLYSPDRPGGHPERADDPMAPWGDREAGLPPYSPIRTDLPYLTQQRIFSVALDREDSLANISRSRPETDAVPSSDGGPDSFSPPSPPLRSSQRPATNALRLSFPPRRRRGGGAGQTNNAGPQRGPPPVPMSPTTPRGSSSVDPPDLQFPALVPIHPLALLLRSPGPDSSQEMPYRIPTNLRPLPAFRCSSTTSRSRSDDVRWTMEPSPPGRISDPRNQSPAYLSSRLMRPPALGSESDNLSAISGSPSGIHFLNPFAERSGESEVNTSPISADPPLRTSLSPLSSQISVEDGDPVQVDQDNGGWSFCDVPRIPDNLDRPIGQPSDSQPPDTGRVTLYGRGLFHTHEIQDEATADGRNSDSLNTVIATGTLGTPRNSGIETAAITSTQATDEAHARMLELESEILSLLEDAPNRGPPTLPSELDYHREHFMHLEVRHIEEFGDTSYHSWQARYYMWWALPPRTSQEIFGLIWAWKEECQRDGGLESTQRLPRRVGDPIERHALYQRWRRHVEAARQIFPERPWLDGINSQEQFFRCWDGKAELTVPGDDQVSPTDWESVLETDDDDDDVEAICRLLAARRLAEQSHLHEFGGGISFRRWQTRAYVWWGWWPQLTYGEFERMMADVPSPVALTSESRDELYSRWCHHFRLTRASPPNRTREEFFDLWNGPRERHQEPYEVRVEEYWGEPLPRRRADREVLHRQWQWFLRRRDIESPLTEDEFIQQLEDAISTARRLGHVSSDPDWIFIHHDMFRRASRGSESPSQALQPPTPVSEQNETTTSLPPPDRDFATLNRQQTFPETLITHPEVAFILWRIYYLETQNPPTPPTMTETAFRRIYFDPDRVRSFYHVATETEMLCSPFFSPSSSPPNQTHITAGRYGGRSAWRRWREYWFEAYRTAPTLTEEEFLPFFEDATLEDWYHAASEAQIARER